MSVSCSFSLFLFLKLHVPSDSHMDTHTRTHKHRPEHTMARMHTPKCTGQRHAGAEHRGSGVLGCEAAQTCTLADVHGHTGLSIDKQGSIQYTHTQATHRYTPTHRLCTFTHRFPYAQTYTGAQRQLVYIPRYTYSHVHMSTHRNTRTLSLIPMYNYNPGLSAL